MFLFTHTHNLSLVKKCFFAELSFEYFQGEMPLYFSWRYFDASMKVWRFSQRRQLCHYCVDSSLLQSGSDTETLLPQLSVLLFCILKTVPFCIWNQKKILTEPSNIILHSVLFQIWSVHVWFTTVMVLKWETTNTKKSFRYWNHSCCVFERISRW